MDKKDKGGVADNPIAYPKHYPKQVVMDKKELGRDMWYQVGDKRYASIEGEEYIRVSDVQQEIDRAKEEERERIRKDFNDIFRAGVSMRVNWQKIEENHYSFKGYLIREEVIGKLLSEFISKLKKEEE